MSFCKNCGAPLTNESKFCQNCGAKIDNPQTAAGVGAGVGASCAFTDTKDYSDELVCQENEKVVCAVSYIWILFFLPLVLYSNSQYARFHSNQALLVLIATAVLGAIGNVASSILYGVFSVPTEFIVSSGWHNFIPNLISIIISALGGLCSFALVLFGLINTLNGKSKEIPLIGHFRIIK